MPDIEHVDIVDAERHEPKGASTATENQIMIADGAGATSWVNPSSVVASSGDGFADYNDAATASTPLTIVADTWLTLTNDGLGSSTLETYLPSGVTQLFDVDTDKFDFSGLSLGDVVYIRNDFTITPGANNAILEVRYSLGTGGSAYELTTVLGRLDAGISTPHRFSLSSDMIYLGDSNTLDNGATYQVRLSEAGTVINHGSVIHALRR